MYSAAESAAAFPTAPGFPKLSPTTPIQKSLKNHFTNKKNRHLSNFKVPIFTNH